MPQLCVNYVLGFAKIVDESNQTSSVLLIQKNRPPSHKGLLNGIGGKIEPMESPIQTMIREFSEEVGPDLFYYEKHWDNFLDFTYYNQKAFGTIFCFRTTIIWYNDQKLESILSNPPTDEALVIAKYEDIVLNKLNLVGDTPLIVQAMYYHFGPYPIKM